MKTKLIVEPHIHGAFGIDFNKASVEDVLFVAKKMLSYGIGGVFPTLVTDSVENIKRQIGIIKQASELQKEDSAKILGIHLEGIFLNANKKGIHNSEYFLPLTVENYKKVEDDFIKTMTIAPELDDGLLEYLSDKDIKIQAGHCEGGNLSYCSGVTHLFNAMKGIAHRGSSTALSALIDDNIYTEIIGDGVHLSDDILKLVFKSKPIDKIILDDCMKDLVENKTIQAIKGNSVDDLKDFMKKQLRESNSIISKQIKTYNELGFNLKAPYSLIGKHMGKVGIDGYRSILVNPAIYKINSTAHLENESKYICCYDIICLCALLNLTELNTSSLYISSITKNTLLTEANEKIAELTNERTHGYMCLHEDKLFMFEENNEDIRKSLSYYSNIIDIVSRIPLITPKNVFKEEKKLKDALKDFYSDFEIESITCAKENNLIILSDDISIIKIGYYYKLTSVGILELMLRNYKSDDIIKACEKLKGFGFYNFMISLIKFVPFLQKIKELLFE